MSRRVDRPTAVKETLAVPLNVYVKRFHRYRHPAPVVKLGRNAVQDKDVSMGCAKMEVEEAV